MPLLYLVALGLLVLIFSGDGASVVLDAGQRKRFAQELLPAARAVHEAYGIPPNISLGKWAHETGYGTGAVYLKTFNLGSITADDMTLVVGGQRIPKPGFESMVAVVDTKEWVKKLDPARLQRPTGQKSGELIEVIEPRGFRKYATPKEGALAWGKMLASSTKFPTRYTAARSGDFALFARELQRTGYGTDPHYAEKLTAGFGKVFELAGVA